MKIKNYILSIVFAVSALTTFSQKLRFKHITNEEGLSSIYVNSIIQDDHDFIWIGTQDGLNKYDGYQIRVFRHDPNDSNSISNSEVIAIRQFSANIIALGTRQGLSILNPINEKFIDPSDLKSAESKINAIEMNSAGEIVFGGDEGLFIYNIKSAKTRALNFNVSDPVLVKCILRVNGFLLVGTEAHGVWKLSGDRLERVEFATTDYLSKFDPKDLLNINDLKIYANNLYLATYGKGIYKVHLDDFEVEENISFKTGFDNSNFIYQMSIDGNRIYSATGYGFIVYNLITKKHTAYYHKENDNDPTALNSNRINAVLRDNEKNLWLGTQLGGLNVAFDQSLKFESELDELQSSYKDVMSLFEDEQGHIWIGGLKTLIEVNRKSGETRNYSSVLQDNYALCMQKTSDKEMWVGTWGFGLWKFDVNTKKAKQVLSKEFGGTIVCLARYDSDHILAGSIGDGLFKINIHTLEWVNFGVKDGLPNGDINSIFCDSRKHWWLGTYDGGLVKIKAFGAENKLKVESIFQNKGGVDQLAGNTVFSVNEDPKGFIWVATSSGLSKLLPDNKFKSYFTKDGLPNAFLYSILKDSLGHFWMSSNYGLIKFNPLLPEKDVIFKSYTKKDGLLNIEYNSGSAFVSASGNMYFGGAHGFNVFRPTSIKDNLHPPKSFIVGYKRAGSDVLTDSSITHKKHLTLTWRENYFQFELVALDYTDPAKNKFKYFLEGYDQDWSAPTNVRYVSYTELPGGEYTFKVKAANNDGVWNEVPYEIHITVIPPFWKTKWFYLLVIVIGTALIFGYTQYRTRAIKKENKILENKVAERTKELAEKNRDITSSIEYARRIQEAILPAREQIYTKLRKIFILYKPKDIVSGDFYWFGEKDRVKIFAVVDCTGHGVPGAFMSMIGHNLIHQIIQEKGITDPGEILNNLHKGVQAALRQGQNEIQTNDGMDVSLMSVNETTGEVKWAGANRPLLLIGADKTVKKVDGNKFPVGGVQIEVNRVFTTNSVVVNGPTMAYMFSDGYADQFGGDKGKKFMVKKFQEVLLGIHDLSPEEQRRLLDEHFEKWRGIHEQVDDVLVVGIGIQA